MTKSNNIGKIDKNIVKFFEMLVYHRSQYYNFIKIKSIKERRRFINVFNVKIKPSHFEGDSESIIVKALMKTYVCIIDNLKISDDREEILQLLDCALGIVRVFLECYPEYRSDGQYYLQQLYYHSIVKAMNFVESKFLFNKTIKLLSTCRYNYKFLDKYTYGLISFMMDTIFDEIYCKGYISANEWITGVWELLNYQYNKITKFINRINNNKKINKKKVTNIFSTLLKLLEIFVIYYNFYVSRDKIGKFDQQYAIYHNILKNQLIDKIAILVKIINNIVNKLITTYNTEENNYLVMNIKGQLVDISQMHNDLFYYYDFLFCQ